MHQRYIMVVEISTCNVAISHRVKDLCYTIPSSRSADSMCADPLLHTKY